MNDDNVTFDPNLDNFLEILRLMVDTDFNALRDFVKRESSMVEDMKTKSGIQTELLPMIDRLSEIKAENI